MLSVSTAGSRQARISAAAGLAAGPFGPRLGWLIIVQFLDVVAIVGDGYPDRGDAVAVEAANLEEAAVSIVELVFSVRGLGVQHGQREVFAAHLVVLPQGNCDLFPAVGVYVSNLHVYLHAIDLPKNEALFCASLLKKRPEGLMPNH